MHLSNPEEASDEDQFELMRTYEEEGGIRGASGPQRRLTSDVRFFSTARRN